MHTPGRSNGAASFAWKHFIVVACSTYSDSEDRYLLPIKFFSQHTLSGVCRLTSSKLYHMTAIQALLCRFP